MSFKTFRDSLLMASAATLLSQLQVSKAKVLLDHFVELQMFEPLTMVFLGSLGVAMYMSVPGGLFSLYSRNINIHKRAFSVYAPIAGAIAGWVLTLSAIELAQTGRAAIPAVTFVIGAMLYLVGVPIASYVALTKLVELYTSTGPTPKRNPTLVRLLSASMIFVVAYFLAQWSNK